MGRLKPQSFRAIKRRLEAAGFVETSQKAATKFVHRTAELVDTAIVPKRTEVPVGTLRSILNQAHIDVNDWDKLS